MNAQLGRRAPRPAAGARSRAATPSSALLLRRAASSAARPVPAAGPQRRRGSSTSASAAADNQFAAQVCVVLGTQWGDEGKGKLVDILAQQYDVVCRAQGGANAGHTIYDDAGNKYALHLVPSGILNPNATNVVGNGVVLHAPGLFTEIERLEQRGVPVLPQSAGGIHPDSAPPRLIVSDRAHLLFDLHKEVDGAREAELAGGQIGTTRRGIGPAYASKATRNGLRVSDLLGDPEVFKAKLRALAEDARRRFPSPSNVADDYDVEKDAEAYVREYAPRLRPLVSDTVDYVNAAFDAGKRLLIEGANATMLDVDFGTYPFVTSSSPSVGGVASGLGLAPTKFESIIGVAKAYTTRVGAGPYPTEILGDLADKIREVGGEYGTTTGRPRRVGWLDMVALRYAHKVNGLTHLCLTKLDVLSGLEELPVAVGYKLSDGSGRVLDASVPADLDALSKAEVVYETLPGWKEDISAVREWEALPENARKYVERVEELCGVPVAWIGVGPGRDAMVCRGDALGGKAKQEKRQQQQQEAVRR